MITLTSAVEAIQTAQKRSKKPLAVILAGHNGSGKSTLWYKHLANQFQIPLINADRMMMSILPEVTKSQPLPQWALYLRDKDPIGAEEIYDIRKAARKNQLVILDWLNIISPLN